MARNLYVILGSVIDEVVGSRRLDVAFWIDDPNTPPPGAVLVPAAVGKDIDSVSTYVVPDGSGGWTFVKQPPPLEPEIPTARLKQVAARARLAREENGVMLSGIRIPTDASAQAKINAARGAYDNGTFAPSKVLDFKGRNGWVSITRAQLNAIYVAVVNHVQDGYTLERSISNGIDAGTITTIDQVVDAFRA